jgi:hypothetical protein
LRRFGGVSLWAGRLADERNEETKRTSGEQSYKSGHFSRVN